MTAPSDLRFDDLAACPLPFASYDQILLGHGSGGTLSADLLRRVFLPAFSNEALAALEDQATLDLPRAIDGPSPRIAFTADAYVVHPLVFPGGDIGKLAVHGTVNDLAVGGATPLWLSAAFVLEEGLSLVVLQRIVASMRDACQSANVVLVTGDTKVVDRGKGDGVYIATSGIGIVPTGRSLSIRSGRPGDRLLLSGTLGDHGIAVLSVREGLEFETSIESDTAPLHDLAQTILDACPTTRCMRDPTRGGLASTAHELAVASNVGVRLAERAIPIRSQVKAACELLGLDPLYVANEGKLLAVVAADDAERALEAARRHPLGRDAAIVGELVARHPGSVTLVTRTGTERLVTPLAGEQLPRIC